MIPKSLIQAERKRILQPPFAWIDRRFIFDGFLASLHPTENLLYFFLCLVSDRDGLSFYSYDKICQLLKLDGDAYIQARNGLLEKKLIAFDGRCFQVLALPQAAVKAPKQDSRAGEASLPRRSYDQWGLPENRDEQRADHSAKAPKPLAEIFKQLPFTP